MRLDNTAWLNNKTPAGKVAPRLGHPIEEEEEEEEVGHNRK